MIGFAKSDIGKAREINQDYYSIPNSDDNLQLFILADGMGGCKGGEIASQLAVTCAKNYILNNFNPTFLDVFLVFIYLLCYKNKLFDKNINER